ncbi:MAG: molybdopterin molybdotransferase MoeA [Planctomycetia bacterium]|nr:molybdopterin molybdotransferase MoeA [Planctomycetia bacterium]
MLTVAEALEAVLAHVAMGPQRRVPLVEALGLVLAEDVASDIDSPPHDKSVVDGYAIRFDDLVEGRTELRVLEEVTAGQVPTWPLAASQATRIMTGAPIPEGADTVAMVERSTLVAADTVRLVDPKLTRGRNITRRGSSMRVGDVVLRAGATIRASEIGLLAEVGRATVAVVAAPRVAVLATGNELVAPDTKPGPSQIRNSNGPMLCAMVAAAGGVPVDLGVGRDDREELRRAISAGLAADMLILSGGVSAGVLDLVPGVLAELAVREVFHKVSVKPGKPIWFGLFEVDGRAKPVFGLPGNPVSGLVCFELFVKPALRKIEGRDIAAQRTLRARLTQAFRHQGERPTYWPAVRNLVGAAEGVVEVAPLPWHGSGDLRGVVPADCLVCFPSGDKQYAVGDEVEVLPLD